MSHTTTYTPKQTRAREMSGKNGGFCFLCVFSAILLYSPSFGSVVDLVFVIVVLWGAVATTSMLVGVSLVFYTYFFGKPYDDQFLVEVRLQYESSSREIRRIQQLGLGA